VVNGLCCAGNSKERWGVTEEEAQKKMPGAPPSLSLVSGGEVGGGTGTILLKWGGDQYSPLKKMGYGRSQSSLICEKKSESPDGSGSPGKKRKTTLIGKFQEGLRAGTEWVWLSQKGKLSYGVRPHLNHALTKGRKGERGRGIVWVGGEVGQYLIHREQKDPRN